MSSDTLVLWKFDSNLDGHFIGHLENEPDACVGMVNHPEYIEFTILSDRIAESGSTTYMWKNTGEVELIPEVFSNGRTSEAVRKSGTKTSVIQVSLGWNIEVSEVPISGSSNLN